MAARVFAYLSGGSTWPLGPDWPMPAWLRSAALELQLQTDAAAAAFQPPSVPPFMQAAVALLVHDMYLATLGTTLMKNVQRRQHSMKSNEEHTPQCPTHACPPTHSLSGLADAFTARSPRCQGPACAGGPPHGPCSLLATTHRRRHALGSDPSRGDVAEMHVARCEHPPRPTEHLSRPHVALCLRRGLACPALWSGSALDAPICSPWSKHGPWYQAGHLTPAAAPPPQRSCSTAYHCAG